MKPLNEIIRGLREDKDLKQSELAEILKTTQQQYSKYENGLSEIPAHILKALADYYELSADFLLGRFESTGESKILEQNLVSDYKLNQLLSDVLSLSGKGRQAVIEYIELQMIKETCTCKKI